MPPGIALLPARAAQSAQVGQLGYYSMETFNRVDDAEDIGIADYTGDADLAGPCFQLEAWRPQRGAGGSRSYPDGWFLVAPCPPRREYDMQGRPGGVRKGDGRVTQFTQS